MTSSRIKETIYLPLYGSKGKIYDGSGLNQWNAKGRVRNPDEVYIPIPKKFYMYKPGFFPARDTIFRMRLPNSNLLDVKVCQENGKALMSNPNKALGRWILRDLFKLEEGELVTKNTLLLYGVDSVRIDKISDLEYEINFSKTGSYEKFMLAFE